SYDPRLGRHPIGEMVADLASREDLRELDVFDHEGRIGWSVDPRRRGQRVAADALHRIRTSSGAEAGEVAPGRVGIPLRKRCACVPCHETGPDPLGGVLLSANRTRIAGSAAAFWAEALATMVAIVAMIAALLMFVTQRIVLDPLSKLVNAMSKAEVGDFF